jgi:release factor glutamine methyltransferase
MITTTISPASAAADDTCPAENKALRPSEYTAALIQTLRTKPEWVDGRSALEIGFGSGVVLAALGRLGATTLCGVDIEAMAVVSGALLLNDVGFGDRLELHRGDMWHPVAGRRFDLIVSNLPQFPARTIDYGDRLPSWSVGGPDGRDALDQFLDGLPLHLAPGGRAIITHNGFIGIDATRERVERHGLALRIVTTVTINLPPEKRRYMSEAILLAETGRSIYDYGPYTFADMHIVEIVEKDRVAA